MDPKTFATPNTLDLEIRIPSGNIEVRAEDTADTRLTITGERDPEEFRIAFTDLPSGGHRLTVEHRERGKRFGWGEKLRVQISVPEGTNVSAESGSADLDVTGRVRSIAFTSGSGDCRFELVDGTVAVKTASGDLSGDGAGAGVKLHTASGDLRVRDVDGDVLGRSASGDVRLGTVGGSVEVSTLSGDVEIAAVAAGKTSVKAVSGDVEIGVARGTRVYLDLHSTSGETVAELDMSDGVAADGVADLELTVGTVSGDIRVVRAAG